MPKNLILAVVLVLLGAGGAYLFLTMSKPAENEPTPAVDDHSQEICPAHQIAEADCPWCDPSIIEARGECTAHGVPEALCAQCNPALIPGFKAENDWCAGHNEPESQCELCQAGQLPPGESQ